MAKPSDSLGLRLALVPAQAAQGLAVFLLAPVAPGIAQFLAARGEPPALAQLVVTAPFLGMLLGSFSTGMAMRIVGIRWLASIAAASCIIGACLSLVAGNFLILFVACAITGAGGAWLNSSLSAVTSMVMEGEARHKFVGLQSATANTIGVILGLSSAIAANRFGWRAPFGAFLLLGGVMLVLCCAFIPPIDRTPQANATSFMRIFRGTWLSCLGGAIVFCIATTQSTVLPFLLNDHGIASPGMRAVVTNLIAGSSVVGSLAYGQFLSKSGPRRLILIAGALGSIAWLIFSFWSGGLLLALLGACLLGFPTGILLPALYTNVMRIAPGEASGQAVALLNAAVFAAAFLNPVLIAPLGRLGPHTVMAAMVVATALATVFALLLSRRASAGAASLQGDAPTVAV